ncbi:nucleotidyltransferase family protein [Candidatus Woesearchaeota archaeon]|nr:nucleotidyltransferase family protein [Candidatus Woesearchaeota archaeon]
MADWHERKIEEDTKPLQCAVILAGGLGTRLYPVTLEIPKPLIPVQGRTLTEHILDLLKEAGVRRVYLSIGYRAKQVMDYFGDGSRFGVDMRYIVEDTPLGTGGWMNMIDCAHPDLEHCSNAALITIALSEVDDPSAFGVARLEGNRIVEFVEKPPRELAPSRFISSGYYIFSPEVFSMIPSLIPPAGSFMLEKQVFPNVAKQGRLFGYPSRAQWFDTGTFERWEKVIKEWRKQ